MLRIHHVPIMTVSKKQFTLGATERLKSRKTIDRVFREGRQLTAFPFKLYYLELSPGASAATSSLAAPPTPARASAAPPASAPPLQAAFAAGSRHFKRAVDRNRIKRLARESYRLQRSALRDHSSASGRSLALFFIYTGKDLPSQALVHEKIGVILQKLLNSIGSSSPEGS